MPATETSNHIVAMVVVAIAISAASVLGGLFLVKKAGSSRESSDKAPAKVAPTCPLKRFLDDPAWFCARFTSAL